MNKKLIKRPTMIFFDICTGKFGTTDFNMYTEPDGILKYFPVSLRQEKRPRYVYAFSTDVWNDDEMHSKWDEEKKCWYIKYKKKNKQHELQLILHEEQLKLRQEYILEQVIKKLNGKNDNLSFIDIARKEQIRYNRKIVSKIEI